MKEKFLNYLLLEADVYNRPLRKRYILLLLCAGAGLVIMMNYAARTGFGFLNNIYSIIMTVVLVFFCGIFSMVVYSWPAADLSSSIGKVPGNIRLTVKRMKVAKGFLLVVIYTGTVSALISFLIIAVFNIENTKLIITVISIIASVWAGAMITRCIINVFEETASGKLYVFLAATVWYYIIVVQIMGFIINSAYSIIL